MMRIIWAVEKLTRNEMQHVAFDEHFAFVSF